MSTATTPLYPIHSTLHWLQSYRRHELKANGKDAKDASRVTPAERFGFDHFVGCFFFTLPVTLTEEKNTRHVVSCRFRVTEPKRSANFIFVQYSFYNFLQNKTCFYQRCLCVPPRQDGTVVLRHLRANIWIGRTSAGTV